MLTFITVMTCSFILMGAGYVGWVAKKIHRWEAMATYRVAYRHGLVHGYRRRERELRHAKRVELHDAQRLADERPDAGPSARVSDVMFHRRHDM